MEKYRKMKKKEKSENNSEKEEESVMKRLNGNEMKRGRRTR